MHMCACMSCTCARACRPCACAWHAQAANERVARESRDKLSLQRALDIANTALLAAKAELAAERAAAGGASAVISLEKLALAQVRVEELQAQLEETRGEAARS